MNKLNIAALIMLFALASCSKKADTNSNQTTANVAPEAKPAVKEIPYKGEIEKGLNFQFYFIKIPQGELVITTGFQEWCEMTGISGKKLDIPQQISYYSYLLEMQTNGLATVDIKQKPQGYDTRFIYEIRGTPQSMSKNASSDSDWIYIPEGECKIQNIVKDVKYQNAYDKGSDFRLIMGTYNFKVSDFGRSQGLTDQSAKFRALIKFNPFNQTYSYQTGDLGRIDSDDWIGHNMDGILQFGHEEN